MTQERIKECIKLLETDGINSKGMVLEILKKELASSLLVQETKIEPKEVFFSCMIPDVDKLTPEMRKYCLQRIGKKIVEDSLQDLDFEVTPLAVYEQLQLNIKGIRVKTRFKYYIEKEEQQWNQLRWKQEKKT